MSTYLLTSLLGPWSKVQELEHLAVSELGVHDDPVDVREHGLDHLEVEALARDLWRILELCEEREEARCIACRLVDAGRVVLLCPRDGSRGLTPGSRYARVPVGFCLVDGSLPL